MIKASRHGEIAFEIIDSLPKDLEKSDSKEFLKGSHGHSHSFDNGDLYLKDEDEYIFGYFEAKDTTLFHEEHGEGTDTLKQAKLPDGIYRLRRANETINDELKLVID